jgi:hypothetical protein
MGAGVETVVTTQILWRGALALCAADLALGGLLCWRIPRERFLRLHGPLVLATGLFWFAMWAVMVTRFWEPVYHYVFPAWARGWIPPAYGALFALMGSLFWRAASRLPGPPVPAFCALFGCFGTLTHIWAIHRGILDGPPMLRGASPVAAAIMPFFEFIFYACLTLAAAAAVQRVRDRGRARG